MSLYLTVDGDIALHHHEADDAGALFALVDANRDHLAPWMPWVASWASLHVARGKRSWWQLGGASCFAAAASS